MMEEDVFGPEEAMEECTDEDEALRVCFSVFFFFAFILVFLDIRCLSVCCC